MILKNLKNFYLLILVLGLGFAVSSCDKDEDLPPIGGFNNADEVGSSNLLAKWPFDGSLNESKSGKGPAKQAGNSFATGIKGQGLNLANGYLMYDALSATLSNIKSDLTMSVWANIPNTGGTTGNATAAMMLTGGAPINASTGPGEAATAIIIESAHFSSTVDTQRVKSLVGVTKADGSIGAEDNVNWWGFDNITQPGQMVRQGGKLAHYVLTWDNTTSKINLYVNGVKATNPEWETKTGAKFKTVSDMKVIFGGWMNNAGITTKNEDWAKPMTGLLDEARIWNKLLSEADISALYQLEKAGR